MEVRHNQVATLPNTRLLLVDSAMVVGSRAVTTNMYEARASAGPRLVIGGAVGGETETFSCGHISPPLLYLKTPVMPPPPSQQTAQFVAFAQSDNFSRTLKSCGWQGTADQKHHRHHHQQHHQQHRWQHHL